MPGFDDTFRLQTSSKQFAEAFAKAFESREKKTGDLLIEPGYSIEAVGDLFYGASIEHANAMTRLLKSCIASAPEASFSAHYDLHCYTCRDEAEFEYSYSNDVLTVCGSYEDIEKIDTGIEDDYCDDKNFVIAGTLSCFGSKNVFKEYIERFGGNVVESLSDEADYLICNKSSLTTDLVCEAKERRIPIISEKDFVRLFGDVGEFEDFGFSLNDNAYVVETHTYREKTWYTEIHYYETKEAYSAERAKQKPAPSETLTCEFCFQEATQDNPVRKRQAPDGEIHFVCDECLEVYGLTDWEPVEGS